MLICGPAALWISPYIVCTMVIFYMDADGTLWQLPGEGSAPSEENEPDLSAGEEGAQYNETGVENSQKDTYASTEEMQEDTQSDTITDEPVPEDGAHLDEAADDAEDSQQAVTTAGETEPAQQATASDSENTQQDTAAAASVDIVSKIPEAQAAAIDVQNEIEQPEESVNDDTPVC